MHRIFYSLLVAAALASCTGQTELARSRTAPVTASNVSGPILTDAGQCLLALQAEPSQANLRLDRTRMRLFNWNTQKNTDTAIQADLSRLADGADLILLQEAVRSSSALAGLDKDYHWSFSPGYQKANMRSGVMTVSRVKPLAQCSLTHYEPWLRSPKATNITEFALAGTDETLLVVNMHLINFTVGIESMRQQLLQALRFVEQHNGPVIVSGDFNTWSRKRRDVVVMALQARGLNPVGYSVDHRKRVFGYALDHTFVRDITVAQGISHSVETSDHNPMSVTLEF